MYHLGREKLETVMDIWKHFLEPDSMEKSLESGLKVFQSDF